MSDTPKHVTKLRLTPARAIARVRQLATDTGKLQWSKHVLEQMEARGIDDGDVLKVLRGGDVEEDPIEGKVPGEWKIKLTRRLSNGRVAGVVTVLLISGRLRLVTAEWEDHR
jgi:Domain of unknown function (DUF4258)